MTVSTLSAMTSRETSEKCMPSWPIEMPSDTEMVPNSIGKPPAACTPSLTALASRSSDRLHGVISFHDDATPICDLTQSSSPMPTARSIPRAAVFSRPSVTSRLRGLMSGYGWHGPNLRASVKYAFGSFADQTIIAYPGGVSGTVGFMKSLTALRWPLRRRRPARVVVYQPVRDGRRTGTPITRTAPSPAGGHRHARAATMPPTSRS